MVREGRRLNLHLEKFSKALFKQSSYERKLSDLIQTVKTHSQRFDNCARLCSYETIRHTNDTVRSHYKDSQDSHQEMVGQLDRLKMDQFQQNNLLGNIVVTEAGNIQQMMGVLANRVSEMSEDKIKDLIETTMKQTLESFLSSSNWMDYRTQDGQSALEVPIPIILISSSSRANASYSQSSIRIPATQGYAPLFTGQSSS